MNLFIMANCRKVPASRLLYLKRCKNLFTASTAYGTACAAAMLGDQESMDRLRTLICISPVLCEGSVRRRMLALQQKDGSFDSFEGFDTDILEHTAEISTCLCRINGFRSELQDLESSGPWQGSGQEDSDDEVIPGREVK